MNDRDEVDKLYKIHGRETPPKNHKEILNSPYKKFWLEAVEKEIAALKSLGVFKLVKRNTVPQGMRVLRLLRVLKTKMCQFEDKIDKHKVRICADGSAEKVEPENTFAPTVV
jgi:hypothetical protein